MKHILMGFRFLFTAILVALCAGVIVSAIVFLDTFCGTYVTIGVIAALVFFVAGYGISIDGG